MARKKEGLEKAPRHGVVWLFIIILLAVFGGIILAAMFVFGAFGGLGNVAVIEIRGVIQGDKSGGVFGTPVTSSKEIVQLIEKAEKNPLIKAVVVEINSPGGSAVASAEIADALKKSKKPVVSVIREIGASGGYWIASASDRIFAHRLSMTGSIGVISSYLEFAGFLDRYNVTYRRLVAGKYKDAGSPYKELTPEEELLYQQKLDMLYDAFVSEVALNRNLDKRKVRELATGFVYLGTEAKEDGLIDEFGGIDEAKEYLKRLLNVKIELVPYKKKASLMDILSEVMSNQMYRIGTGIGEGLFNSARMYSYPQPALA